MLSCRIAQLRRSIGLNQLELAKNLHLSPSTIGMYEQGRRVPNIEVLIQMSQLFNVSLDYLLTGLEFSSSAEALNRNLLSFRCPYVKCSHYRSLGARQNDIGTSR